VLPFALAPLAVVASVAVAMHPLAMALCVIIASVVALFPVPGPDVSYLDRAPVARVVTGRVVTDHVRTVVRFLPPVDDVTGEIARVTTPDDVRAEIDRLVACLHRANASRHKARAAGYAARIDALTASV
jgi:hypothetical protein